MRQDRRNDEADVAHELALQKTLAELKLLAKEKFDQVPSPHTIFPHLARLIDWPARGADQHGQGEGGRLDS